MELKTMTYIVVGLTFLVYIGIAIWSRASTTGEFYVAGKGIHPVANGMATAADWMSAASFISMAGLIAFLGYGGSVFLMGWTGGYVLLAMLLPCSLLTRQRGSGEPLVRPQSAGWNRGLGQDEQEHRGTGRPHHETRALSQNRSYLLQALRA